MNLSQEPLSLSLRVWLPPDGDSRLLRFQGDVVSRTGRPEAGILPPHLVLDPGRDLGGPLALGTWEWTEGRPALEALDGPRRVGTFQFVLPGEASWPPEDRNRLPSPPDWVWTRGRFLTLTLERQAGVVRWTWSLPSGWKASPSKG